jgi:hypothetical protein
MNWNLGEENNQPIEEVKKAARYVWELDPYQHHLVIHTFPNQDDRYAELIGDQSPLTGASLQLSDEEFKDVHPRVLKWREMSNATGKRWALAVDEPGKAQIALLPDDEDLEHNLARSNAMWGTLMAGGFGVEWYFGYASPNSDLTCQDFRSRDLFWDQNRYALHFFENYIPFWDLQPADELTDDDASYCLTDTSNYYVVFLPMDTETTKVDLGDSDATFSIQWYDPRNGGNLVTGTVESVKANGSMAIGLPPDNVNMDWVALLKKED